MHKTLLALSLIGLSTLAAAAPTLVRNAQVFDGERMHAHRSVLFEHGVIVDPDYRGAAPADAVVVDGSGRTLLPGLIDAHVHAYRHQELPLLFGVTTQVDMFTSVAALKRGQDHAHADLFSAGTLVTAPGGHGTEFGLAIPTLARAADAQAFVDARIAEGSHFIKIVMEDGPPGHPMPSLDRPTVKAVIAAAHARGKLAVVHISTLANARAALEDGADGLAHLFNGERIAPAALAQLVALAKAHHAFVIPTLSVLESMAGVPAADILVDASLTALLDKEQATPLATRFSPEAHPAQLAVPKALTAAMARAGVPVLAGTDAGNPGTQYGISLHHELAALVDAGLTPRQALAAATSVPAQAFRLGRRGRIAAGYKADLLLVDGDPGKDIGATRRIVGLWKDGDDALPLRAQQLKRVAAQSSAPRRPLALPADGRISLFEDGKLGSPIGAGWSASSDQFFGGKSQVELQVQTGGSVLVKAQVQPGFAFPWAGLAFMPGAQPMQAADVGAVAFLRFRVRGDGQRYNVAMMSSGVNQPASQGFTAGAQWQEVAMPMSGFTGIDAAALTMISFNAGPAAGSYQFELADVRLTSQ